MNATRTDDRTARLVLGLGTRAPSVVTDLSLGAWRPRQAAHELAAQLGLTLSAPAAQVMLPDLSAFDYGAVIGAGVDAEARGDAMLLAAHADAAAIAPALESARLCVIVLGPRFGGPWREDNVAFLRFLRDLRGDGGDDVLVVPDPDDTSDARWTRLTWDGVPDAAAPHDSADLIPGLVDAGLAQRLGDAARALVPLRGGASLVAPARRAARAPRGAFDRLAALDAGRFVRAYATLHGTAYFADAAVLLEDAWAAFGEHALDLALQLCDYADACAGSSGLRAAARASGLGMAIATQRYARCAATADVPPDAPVALRAFVREGRAWGQLMCGAAAQARAAFEPLVEALLGQAECSVSDLYRLNIMALARFRDGDAAGALALERAIESRREGSDDYRLAYINELNTARILRALGDADGSARRYAVAFSTSDGLRGAAEHVQRNAVLAGIAEQCGDPEAARAAWFRAALHWLAHPVPEALGPRVVAAVARDAAGAGSDPVARTSNALLARLSGSGDEDCDGAAAPPAFVAAAAPPGSDAVGARGWAVAVTTTQPRVRVRDAAYTALRRLAGAQVRRAAGAVSFDTVFVDDRGGREVPLDAVQARATFARSARSLRYDGAPIGLGGVQLVVALGPAVAAVDAAGGVVRYKRHRPPRHLDRDELALIARLRDGALPLAALAESGAALRRLEDDRVVVLDPAEVACT